MATQDLFKLQRPTVAQTSAMPSSAAMQQQSKALGGGLQGPAATNEYLSQQTRGSGGGAGFGRNQQMQTEKRMLRASTPLARASYLDNFVRQNESMRAALPDSEPFKIDLRNPVGATMDESFNNDREMLSPEARAIQEDARKSLKSEVARLLSGANKQGWNSIEDLNEALNSLPTVQKHGPLVEGLLHQIARSAVGPEMNAKFSANDANVRSFVDWAKRRGVGLEEDKLVDAFHNGATGLRSEFESDPNAPKYDAVGDKVVPRQITPDQQMQGSLKLEDARYQAQLKRSQDQLAANPDLAKTHDIDPNTGALDRKPEPKVDPVEQGVKSAMQKQELDRRLEALGIKPTDADRAEMYGMAGMPIPEDPKNPGKPILPSSEFYKYMVDEVETFDQSGNKVKSLVLKPQFKEFGGKTGASGQAAKTIDRDTASEYMAKAGGDPAKARELAKADGWSF